VKIPALFFELVLVDLAAGTSPPQDL